VARHGTVGHEVLHLVVGEAQDAQLVAGVGPVADAVEADLGHVGRVILALFHLQPAVDPLLAGYRVKFRMEQREGRFIDNGRWCIGNRITAFLMNCCRAATLGTARQQIASLVCREAEQIRQQAAVNLPVVRAGHAQRAEIGPAVLLWLS